MFNASLPSRRLSHAFLDCLCDASDNAAATTTATPTTATTATAATASDGSNGRHVEEENVRDEFALIVVNGEVGKFLTPLWRHGQTDNSHTLSQSSNHSTNQSLIDSARERRPPLSPLARSHLLGPSVVWHVVFLPCQLPFGYALTAA